MINSLARQNFKSLKKMYPEYADAISGVPETSCYTVVEANGSVTCRDASGNWIHGPDDPRLLARSEADRAIGAGVGLYVVLRPSLGYQAFAFLEAVERHVPGSLVLVVEDRLELFKLALGLTDWAPVLHADFCVLLLGALDVVIESFFERHPKLLLLPITIVTGRDIHDTQCQVVAEKIRSMVAAERPKAEEHLAGADTRLAQRRSRNEPLRILLAGPEFGYLSGPIADGFRECRCSVEVHVGEKRTPRHLRAHEWFWQLSSRAPDLVLWMNRPEIYGFGSHAFRTLSSANVLWTVDSPRRMQLTHTEMEAVDLHICFDQEYLVQCSDLGARSSGQLSLAAGLEPLPGCEPGAARWPQRQGPEISFVGSLGEDRVRDLRESIRKSDPEKLALLDSLAEVDDDPAEAFTRETGRTYEGLPCLYVDEMRLARRRTNVLRQMPRSLLKIYGGLDWAGERSPIADCYAGRSVAYGADLAAIYYHSAINLNVFHAQCLDSTNSRIYDVLAVGGFLLSEDRPALHREFEVGRHLITFSDPEEAAEKAVYYLSHPAERETIAREGQRHVLTHHTFAERCRRLLARARPFMGSSRASWPLAATPSSVAC